MASITSLAVSIKHLNDAMRLAKYNMAKQYGLNTSEFEVLVSLHNAYGPLSIKQLSSELLLCSQAITKICKNLQALGLVESNKSDHDKRITRVGLTPAGKKIAGIEAEYRERIMAQAIPEPSQPYLEQIATTFLSLQTSAATLAMDF